MRGRDICMELLTQDTSRTQPLNPAREGSSGAQSFAAALLAADTSVSVTVAPTAR